MPTQNIYPLSDVDNLQDKVTGIRVQRDGEPDLKLLWDDNDQEWRLRDQQGEKYVTGDRGNVTINSTPYSLSEDSSEKNLFVKTGKNNFKIAEGTFESDGGLGETNAEYVLLRSNFAYLIKNDVNGQILYKVTRPGFSEDSFFSPSGGGIITSASNRLTLDSEFIIAVDDGENADIVVLDSSLQETQRISTYESRSVDVKPGTNSLATFQTDAFRIYDKNSSTGNYELSNTSSTVSGTFEKLAWNSSGDKFVAADNFNSTIRVYDKNLNSVTTFNADQNKDITWRSDDYLSFINSNGEVEVYDSSYSSVTTLTEYNFNAVNFSTSDELVTATDSGVAIFDTSFNEAAFFSTPTTSGDVDATESSEGKRIILNGRTGSSGATMVIYENEFPYEVDMDSSFSDTFQTRIVNDGSWYLKFTTSGSAEIQSSVGSNPFIIDKSEEVKIRKIGADTFLVTGDIYKETGDGFTQSL